MHIVIIILVNTTIPSFTIWHMIQPYCILLTFSKLTTLHIPVRHSFYIRKGRIRRWNMPVRSNHLANMTSLFVDVCVHFLFMIMPTKQQTWLWILYQTFCILLIIFKYLHSRTLHGRIRMMYIVVRYYKCVFCSYKFKVIRNAKFFLTTCFP